MKSANTITDQLNKSNWKVTHTKEALNAINIIQDNFFHAFILNISSPTLGIDSIKEIIDIVKDTRSNIGTEMPKLPIMAIHNSSITIDTKKRLWENGIPYFLEIPNSLKQLTNLSNKLYHEAINSKKQEQG